MTTETTAASCSITVESRSANAFIWLQLSFGCTLCPDLDLDALLEPENLLLEDLDLECRLELDSSL